MSRNNVIPFPRRQPSAQALEIYRHMTRHWSNELKRLLLPEYFRADQLARHRPC